MISTYTALAYIIEAMKNAPSNGQGKKYNLNSRRNSRPTNYNKYFFISLFIQNKIRTCEDLI